MFIPASLLRAFANMRDPNRHYRYPSPSGLWKKEQSPEDRKKWLDAAQAKRDRKNAKRIRF